jgi:ferredoxin
MKTEISKIKINREICIGCGSCVALAHKAFELKGGKSSPKKDWQKEEIEKIVAAAQACPVGAISLLDKEGKKII